LIGLRGRIFRSAVQENEDVIEAAERGPVAPEDAPHLGLSVAPANDVA
jgi:hypothetical protein